jgi:hypothetical protein
MRTSLALSSIVLASMGPIGCLGEASPEGTAQAVAELQVIPTLVGCLRVVFRAPGATNDTTRNFGVTPGLPATLDLGYLAAGAYAFRASAFNGACSSVGASTVASWVGEPVAATITPGIPTRLAFTLRPNVTTTSAVDFVQPVRAIFAGQSAHTTFAVMQDGTVRAWGRNELGQMGDGTSATSPAPRVVMGLTNPTQIEATEEYGCATTGGGLACWGFFRGVVADDGPLQSLIPRFNPDLEPQSISLGASGICGGFGEQLSCWHSVETLGGPTVAATSFAAAATYDWWSRDLLYVSPAGQLLRSGSGRLAHDHQLLRDRVLAVSISGSSYCALAVNGAVSCAELDGNSDAGSETTVAMGPATAVQAGYAHRCALLADRRVRCWGSNNAGQLGAALDQWGSTVPVDVGLTDVTQIAAGSIHTCALRTDGSVWCWGSNQYGQLGDGTRITRFSPVRVRF